MHIMESPSFLKPGSCIGIVAPAKYIDEKYITRARSVLENKGFHVKIGNHVFNKHHRFSGTDAQRLQDMQEFLDHPEIDAVLCARGGYGSVRIIDQLDFTQFQKSPKWLAGFSDITVFHSHILQNHKISTLHATVPLYFPGAEPTDAAVDSLFDALTGVPLNYQTAPHGQNRTGSVTAPVVGGNLSIVASLVGTNSDTPTDGNILFLEEVSEYDYRVDRMLYTLKKAGKLSRLAGLIIGDLKDMKTGPDSMGKSVPELIAEAVEEYDYPVCFNFPGGHTADNMALPLGEPAQLDVTKEHTYISFHHGRTQRTG